MVIAEDVFETMAKAEQLALETGFNKVLLDLRAVTALPPVEELFEIVSKHPRNIWIAAVIKETEALEREFDFFDTVARNRGRLTRLFGSKDEAIEWLQKMG